MADDKETTPNLTDKHPALQIYETLRMIRDIPNPGIASPISVLWVNAAGKEVSHFKFAWFKLLELVNEWRMRVERDLNVEELKRMESLRFIGLIFGFISEMNTMMWDDFRLKFNDDILRTFVFIPGGDLKVESPITVEDLSDIQSQILDLINSVRASSLPGEVKRNLLDALYDLMDITADYDLYSVADLKKRQRDT